MNTVLVTGSAGLVGRAVVPRLAADGWSVRGFDLANGDDLRDEEAVAAAAAGCRAIVHTAAIAHDTRGTPAEIVATNVLGTWHVLLAAERHGAERVVHFSSAQVFGFAEGEGQPDYRPVDDHHPLRAARPYGMSKRLSEEMCAAWTRRTGTATVVLRPVMILDEGAGPIPAEAADMGSFVRVEDVADAVARAVACNLAGHVRMTLCGVGEFDTRVAEQLLGWRPRAG